MHLVCVRNNTNILWQIFCSCIKNFTNVFLYYSILHLLFACLSDPSEFVLNELLKEVKELWYVPWHGICGCKRKVFCIVICMTSAFIQVLIVCHVNHFHHTFGWFVLGRDVNIGDNAHYSIFLIGAVCHNSNTLPRKKKHLFWPIFDTF